MTKVTDAEIESILKRSDYSETKRFAQELKDARVEIARLSVDPRKVWFYQDREFAEWKRSKEKPRDCWRRYCAYEEV